MDRFLHMIEMTPETWRRIERIFQGALARDLDTRPRFLDEVCEGDTDLRSEVDALLRAHDDPGSFLDKPPAISSIAGGLDRHAAFATTRLGIAGFDLTAGDSVDATPFHPGQLVSGRFRVVREVAAGGMGVVYLATDEKLHQPRALKCAKAGFASRLGPEARSSLRVTHPNVCRVFEIHSTDTPSGPVDFLTMEFIDGGTLSSAIEAHGALPLAEADAIGRQICAGVAAAHAEGVLHRDLKSNNVLLTKDTHGHTRAVVTDFGLAQLAQAPDAGPAISGVAGTPVYLAPERWRGEPATVASDIYALGVVLHEVIAGVVPDTKPGSTRAGIKSPVPGLPARWHRVIARCVDEDPSRRYASAADVALALSGRAQRWRPFAFTAAALAAAAFVLWRVLMPAPLATRLAVLPLDGPEADPQTATLIQGASLDLSTRLMRLRPRPPEVVVIPLEDTRGLTPRDLDQARSRLGATHVLTGTIRREGEELVVDSAVIDTSTKVALRTFSSRYRVADAGAVAPALASMVAAAFRLPRQVATETIAPAAYPAFAEGLSYLLNSAATYAQAIAAFERAIQLDPASILPRTALAKACYEAWVVTTDAQWLARGRAELAKAVAMNPDSVAVHLAAGRLNLAPGSYAQSVQEYQRAIDLDPKSQEGWRGLARAYEGVGDHDNDAAAAYLQAIALQPDYYAPHSDLGGFYRQRGSYAEAEKEWQTVIALAPSFVAGLVNLGALYSDEGRYDDAERVLKRAFDVDPRWRPVLNNLAALYQYRRQDDVAVTYLEKARAEGPDAYTLELNLGDSYRRLNQTAAASAAYQRGRALADPLLNHDPSNAALRSFVAYFNLRLGDRTMAERDLLQALNMGSSNDKSLIRRAVICYEALDRRDQALEVLRRPAATADVLKELNRQPDLSRLQQDPRFIARLRESTLK